MHIFFTRTYLLLLTKTIKNYEYKFSFKQFLPEIYVHIINTIINASN